MVRLSRTSLFLCNFKAVSSLTVPQTPGIQLDLFASKRPPIQSGRIGLGDYADAIYNVQIHIGGNQLPVVLDTGSSDLWVISSNCNDSDVLSSNLPLYPQDSPTFVSSNLDTTLLYGDSHTGTRAFGRIGQDSINLAGLHLDGQYLAAINNTNTGVTETGSVGIFGLGFPLNSAIWSNVFLASRYALTTTSRRQKCTIPQFSRDYSAAFFPRFEWLTRTSRASNIDDTSSMTSRALASYSSQGPLLVRLIELNRLSVPGFTVSLQRNSVDKGSGNVGLLSIGEFPPRLCEEDFHWVPLRHYLPSQGGLHPPNDIPNETYPISWEIYLDDVYLDGHKLPRSNLSSPAIALSALVDTGNSLLRGPTDVVSHIYHTINQGPGETFPCDAPHTLAFEIGGRLFPVDPRDFISQAFENQVELCTATLVDTDVPVLSEEGGYLYGWNLGVPFMKSVITSFYYGNVTHPSRDPPRMGFKSTVPLDAGKRLKEVVEQANRKRKKI
ncbi:aspartic peptidase domain-containing protein [Flagelloscypha sp. PMI_526]|nr:aspartic peptidase domain-containing protein [Flagelloscypha sp. PMI_526]